MRPLAFVGAGFLLATVQAVLVGRVGGGTVPIQLLVPCLAWLALEADNVEGLVAAAGIGLTLDAFAGSPGGLFAFLGVATFLGCRAAAMAVDLRGRAGFAVLAGAACLGLSTGAVLLQRWTGEEAASPGATLLPRMLAEAALTAAVAPLVRLAMNRIDGLLGREEPGIVP